MLVDNFDSMIEECETQFRKIIHIDMDAFFASVEQRDNPVLMGKPVAVGVSSRRGVVAAASYEARQYGVRSAMPSVTAVRRCPSLVFVSPRFEVYRSVSEQIRSIFKRYSDLVEPLSLDEAYLDVTQDKQAIGSAVRTAELIRSSIKKQTGLTASAGVSYNKFLAKVASDQNKPDGIFVVRPLQGEEFVAGLPVRRFYGVGPKTAERMKRLGIQVGADLRCQTIEFLREHFGKSSDYLFNAARGVDNRQVRSDRLRKSVGRERTFQQDLQSESDLKNALGDIIASAWERIEKSGAMGRTVTLKMKYADFRQITRARSVDYYIDGRDQFSQIAYELLDQLLPVSLGVRLMGVAISSLIEKPLQDKGRVHDRQHTFDF